LFQPFNRVAQFKSFKEIREIKRGRLLLSEFLSPCEYGFREKTWGQILSYGVGYTLLLISGRGEKGVDSLLFMQGPNKPANIKKQDQTHNSTGA
jgi:hypothetical protein